MNIFQAMGDSNLFARWFAKGDWSAWRVFLAVLFGLPLTDDQAALLNECSGRSVPLAGGSNEAWLICGRRAGKSFILSLIAVYLATFRDWRPHLQPGERGTVMILAADREQARTIFRYIEAMITEVPMMAKMVTASNKWQIDLNNRISVEVRTASFRTTRGYSVIAALCDEIAYWRSDDSANPDFEILEALRPGMATIPGAMLLCASSPYARRGALWETFKAHWGDDESGTLVWKAPTRTMNPSVPQATIDAAYRRDQLRAAAEYGAEFRSDVASFVSQETVRAVTVEGRYELPRERGRHYVGFVDPSGGSFDSMTLAIAHDEDGVAVLDCVREARPPFSPNEVTAEFSGVLRDYGLSTVTGDRYAGQWPRERFKEHGITYRVSDRVRSELYRDLLPVLNSGRVELLDHQRLAMQLVSLERRTGRAGKDTIDHPPKSHDDLINAAAGALVMVRRALRKRIYVAQGEEGDWSDPWADEKRPRLGVYGDARERWGWR